MSRQKTIQTNRFRPKFHVKAGDTVLVISGDDKGKRGAILNVDTKTGRAIVEGVNFITKHIKRVSNDEPGRVIKKEAPIQISNLKLIDPRTDKPTKIGKRLENGVMVRYAKISGNTI